VRYRFITAEKALYPVTLLCWLLHTSSKSARHVADELGMPQSVLSRWKCTADNAQKTPAETLSMEEEVRQLRRENERLRMEREVLKKATAFFAKEST